MYLMYNDGFAAGAEFPTLREAEAYVVKHYDELDDAIEILTAEQAKELTY
jgi:hypothetical protein